MTEECEMTEEYRTAWIEANYAVAGWWAPYSNLEDAKSCEETTGKSG